MSGQCTEDKSSMLRPERSYPRRMAMLKPFTVLSLIAASVDKTPIVVSTKVKGSTWHLGPLLGVDPLGTYDRSMRESHRVTVKDLRSKLSPKEGLGFSAKA